MPQSGDRGSDTIIQPDLLMKLPPEPSFAVGILLFCLVKGEVEHQTDQCVPFPKQPACGCTLNRDNGGKTIDPRSLGYQNGQAR